MLREAAIQRACATRLPGRAELYRLPDGQTVIMRTNRKRCIINNTDNMFVHEGVDALMFVAPKEVESLQSGFEVYIVPLSVARLAFDKARADWMKTDPDTSGHNNMDSLYLDNFSRFNGKLETMHDYASKWGQYRLAETDSTSALPQLEAHEVDYRGYRIVSDQQILSASTLEGLITVLNLTTRFRAGPSPSNADYMREVAERARVFPGKKIRFDTARHFLDDMAEAGAIIWIKREIALG